MGKAITRCLGLLFLLYIIVTDAKANHDIISNYNPNSEAIYYNDPSIKAYAARFDIEAPCTIEELTIRLAGIATERAAVLYIYGQEGGATIPAFQKQLTKPIVVAKRTSGLEPITITLPAPIHTANNQIFVVVQELHEQVVLVSDSKIKESACLSQPNEPFLFQFLQDQYNNWRYGLFGFGIDLHVSYDVEYHKNIQSPSSLVNVTSNVGIDTSLSFKSIAWADINRDGWQDVLVGGKLFANSEQGFVEKSQGIGLSQLTDFAFFVDADNDNYSDIIVVQSHSTDSTQSGGIIVYHNENGKFTDTDLLPLPVIAPTCFAIADVNNDSYADIFIGQGEDSIGILQPDILLINDGQGRYLVQSEMNADKSSKTIGAAWIDYNNDRKPDLYLVKFNGYSDELWQNNGDGTFTNVFSKVIGQRNTDRIGYKIGCDWADYDNDGDMDILQPQQVNPHIHTQYKQSGSTLLKNSGAPDYNFQTVPSANSGIELEEKHAGGSFGDVNNDGLLDIILTTNCACRYADMYIQKKDHTFELQSYQFGIHQMAMGIDATWVDFNNDGKLDLATGVDGKFVLLANVGSYNTNYTSLDLSSLRGNAQAVGAEVTVYSNDERYTKYRASGRGYAMQPPLQLHFGIGNSTKVDSVVVKWPDGHSEVFKDIPVNQVTNLVEKSGAVSGVEAGITAQAYPNPFSMETIFEYEIPQSERVLLEVYTLLGEHIITLINGQQPAGNYRIRWDGRNKVQSKMSNGTYLYKLTVGGKGYTGHITIEG